MATAAMSDRVGLGTTGRAKMPIFELPKAIDVLGVAAAGPRYSACECGKPFCSGCRGGAGNKRSPSGTSEDSGSGTTSSWHAPLWGPLSPQLVSGIYAAAAPPPSPAPGSDKPVAARRRSLADGSADNATATGRSTTTTTLRTPQPGHRPGSGGVTPPAHSVVRMLASLDVNPFDSLSRPDRLCRPCDFTFATMHHRSTREGRMNGAPVTAAAGGGDPDEGDFQLVDSRTLRLRQHHPGGPGQRFFFGVGPGGTMRRQFGPGGQFQGGGPGARRGPGGPGAPGSAMVTPVSSMPGGASAQGARMRSGSVHRQQMQHAQMQRQQQWLRNNRQRQLAEWSIEPQSEWTLTHTFLLPTLPRHAIPLGELRVVDLDWRGTLCAYNRSMDRILPRHPRPLLDSLRRERSFYWTGTADDVLLTEMFENNPSVHVAMTSQILAAIMAAAQSKLSWHLNLQKAGNRIMMDKQNGSSIDLLTVDETSREAPLADNPVKINRPAALAAEALYINQAFSQQVLLGRADTPLRTCPMPKFVDPKDKPALRLYRYRVFTLPPLCGSGASAPSAKQTAAANAQVASSSTTSPPMEGAAAIGPGQSSEHSRASSPQPLPAPSRRDPVKIVVRAEVDAAYPDQDKPENYLLVRCLNEYDPHRTGKSWQVQLESQKGALVAQETKNNHYKVAKWVSEAIISGCQTLKIAFVTRAASEANDRHIILNVQTYRVRELGMQIGLSEEHAWGVVRAVLDVLLRQPDGTYTLVKDPLKAELKLFRTQFGEAEELANTTTATAAPAAPGPLVVVSSSPEAVSALASDGQVPTPSDADIGSGIPAAN